MPRVEQKMLINAADKEEQRVAIVENGILQELAIETSLYEQIKGNIYKGVVIKIKPALEAAFIDYGGKKAGFLPFSEVQSNLYAKTEGGAKQRRKISIQEGLKINQKLMVQVIKEELGDKGAFLSTYVSLPGRYLVLMPGSDNTGISRKIEDESQRKRLRKIIEELNVSEKMGLIVRTAGLDRGKRELMRDLNYLTRLWGNIHHKYKTQQSPSIIYHERDLITRSIRDYFTSEISEVLVDTKEVFYRTKDFFRITMPRFQNRVKLYRENKPIFSHYHLEKQIESIYERRIYLDSGGYIVIDPTEALVSIDVNSGKAKKGKDIEETAYMTNKKAAQEIARQLRLRDLGGLVVIDFIDMKDKKHIKEIEKCFKQAIKRDKARIHCSPISKLGLMEISRQRIKPAVKASSYIKCDSCNGTGMVKSIEASALEVLRKIRAEASKKIYLEIRGTLSKDVANYLLNNKKKEIVRLEEEYELKINLKGEADCPKSRYHLDFVRKELPETDDKTVEKQKATPWKSKESMESGVPENESDSLIKDLLNAFHKWRKKKKEV